MAFFETSSALGFSQRGLPRFLIAPDDNPATSAMLSPLMVFLPDPASTQVSSEFITTLTGATANWTVRIFEITNGTVFNAAEVYGPQTLAAVAGNVLWIELSPNVFSTDHIYRVQITDDGANVCDEWDFGLYNVDTIPTGVQDVAAINDKILRIQGLLGYYRRITYSDFSGTVPGTTLIELLDPADGATVLTSYRVQRTLTATGEVSGVTSATVDNTVLA